MRTQSTSRILVVPESVAARQIQAASTDPLLQWRSIDPLYIDQAAIGGALNVLRRSISVFDRRWHDGVNGDAAAAIAVAMHYGPNSAEVGIGADMAMTSVLIHGRCGDEAAMLVLEHALRILSRTNPILRRLATCWKPAAIKALDAIQNPF